MERETKASEAIIQILFAFEFSGVCDEELIDLIMYSLEISKQKARTFFDKAVLIWQARETLDKEIIGRSMDYDFSRIGGIEKGILRYALFTLQDKEINVTLVLKDAMRLAKKFSAPHAAKYINAVLDATPISAT